MSDQNTVTNPQRPTANQKPASFFRVMLLILASVLALATLASFIGGILFSFWPLFLLAASFAISTLLVIFTLSSIWNAPVGIKLLVTLLAVELSFVLTGGIISFGYGLPIAFVAIVIAFLFTALNPSGWLNEWMVGFGFFGALASALLAVLGNMPHLSNFVIDLAIILLDVAAVLLFIELLRRGLITATLRLKLTLAALLLAIVPLVILTIINTQSIQNTVSAQSNDSLRVATELTVSQLDDFFNTNLTTLENAAALPAVVDYLQLSPDTREGSSQQIALATTLNSLQANAPIYAPSFGVLNLLGQDTYDTNPDNIGKSEQNADYFLSSASTHTNYVSSVEFISGTREAYIYFITPITTDAQKTIGYLRMTYDARILQSELEKMSGLVGTHSYPILIDENGIRLADMANPDLLYHSIQTMGVDTYTSLIVKGKLPSYLSASQLSSPIDEISNAVLQKRQDPYTFFDVPITTGNDTVTNSATYGGLTTQSWYVVYLQENTALLNAQQSLQQSTAVVAVIIASIVSILIAIVSTLFSRPIIDLTEIAQTIAAGDLDVHVMVNSKDEIGKMGEAFNSMAQQLKASFVNMENRVRERTQEIALQNETLRYRSRQLQTVTDVARIVASKNDVESLLTLVTELISDRFNFYHAGIFLLDDQNEYAVLRASNSPGGQRMLNRQHKLKVGQVGIVGYVTGTGLPRIATDVGRDAVFFNNPDLPETKSEMALPLKIEEKVIGALDIQSTDSNAFTEEDVRLFTTLADQISVAINNNLLLAETQKALDEAQNLHRQYLNQEWAKRTSDTGVNSYKFSAQGLSAYTEDLSEIKMVFESGRPVTRSGVQEDKTETPYSTLAVPILLRGEVIGVIHLQENGNKDFTWSENDLVTVQTLADQLAQTLESARLFEQTIRRADRERRVLEITSKIRSTNDPQQMLEVTLEELKRHLGVTQAQIVINLPGNVDSYESSAINESTSNKEGTK
jgi:GAF domain-containing protein/HAMP domain-containing protein